MFHLVSRRKDDISSLIHFCNTLIDIDHIFELISINDILKKEYYKDFINHITTSENNNQTIFFCKSSDYLDPMFI